jgi:cytochrome c556
MRRSHSLVGVGLTAALTVTLTAAAAADEGMINYRKSVMKAVGGHTTAIAGIVKGDVPFQQDLKGHITALAALSQMAGQIFPEGSDKGDTTALPSIWQKPDDFRKAMTAFQSAAANLAKVADADPKAAAAAFGDLTKTCKGCHDDFRKKT